MTYTNAEFFPGPNLNMIIGPNGTGKSSIVCAICIGLGWSTSHLGRAKDISEFVKHGRKQAEIEIELKADPARHSENPVITHRINRDGGGKSGQSKSIWLVNGKKSNHKTAQELARSFSIQVDNLCQFLPQDRVVEFAALSPVDLLAQTQRAAAPDYVSEWHDQLKSMGKEHKQKQDEQQTLIENLKKMEDRQRSQQDEVNRLRERTTLQAKVVLLEKMKPFAEYSQLVKEHGEAKARRKEANKELQTLERKMRPNQEAVERKKEYCGRLEKGGAARTRLLKRLEGEADNKLEAYNVTKNAIDECGKRLEVEKKSVKQAKASINSLQPQIRDIKRTMENPPDVFDAAEYNEQDREMTRNIRRLDDEISEIHDSKRSLTTQAQQRQEIIKERENDKENLQSQAGRLTNKLKSLSSDTAKAWEWIQSNRNAFEGPVFGPPVIECSLKDTAYASQVETVIGQGELLSFTVTSKRDFNMLDEQLYRKMKLSDITIRRSLQRLDQFSAPCTEDELSRFGLQSWLINLIEGPPDVLAMLCDNRSLHATAFTSTEITPAQYKALQGPESPVNSWVTRTQQYQVVRRREYGDHVTSRVQSLKPARILTDAPVDTQQEREINQQIAIVRGELSQIKEEMDGVKRRFNELTTRKAKITEDRKALKDEKERKQRQQSEFNGLSTKLESLEKKLQDAKAQVLQQGQRRMAIIRETDELHLKKGQQALDYASAVEKLRDLHKQVLEAEISIIEAQSDVAQLEARNAEDQRLLQERQAEVEQLRAVERQAMEKGRALQENCIAVRDGFNDDEQAYHDEKHEQGWNRDQLETDIQSAQAALDSLLGGNENVIREFEQRAQKIEEKRAQLIRLRDSVEELSNKIDEIRAQWEPQLDLVIEQISTAFSENFQGIGCAGEVAIHKDDDFEQWAIQIRVKFREKEELSILDSHRQSGGERAVSTIFYLMALQSLAKAPFRVVDEINQGMDPRNERYGIDWAVRH